MSPQTTWKHRATINVFSAPGRTAREVPYGPGHKPKRVRHLHGPAVRWITDGKLTGVLERGEQMDLEDRTFFEVDAAVGQATLRLEEAV